MSSASSYTNCHYLIISTISMYQKCIKMQPDPIPLQLKFIYIYIYLYIFYSNITQLSQPTQPMKSPTNKQTLNSTPNPKHPPPAPQPISISQLSQLTISASAGTSSYTSSLLSSICGTPSSIKIKQKKYLTNQKKLHDDDCLREVNQGRIFIQVQKQNRNNFYIRNNDNNGIQKDIDIMDFQQFQDQDEDKDEDEQSNLLDSTLKSKSNIIQNKIQGNMAHKQNSSYKQHRQHRQHRYSSTQPIQNPMQKLSSPIATTNKISANTVNTVNTNTVNTNKINTKQTQNSHESSNNKKYDHARLQINSNPDDNQNTKNIKQFDPHPHPHPHLNNSNTLSPTSPSSPSSPSHKISQSSRQILLQAQIIQLQMKCSVLMGIIHKNNYKNAQHNNNNNMDFINQSSLSLMNQSLTHSQINNSQINNSHIHNNSHINIHSTSPIKPTCSSLSRTQSHITQQLQQLSQMQNYINYYKQQLQKYQISIQNINKQYIHKIKQLQHQLEMITNKLGMKQQEIEIQRKCNAQMINKNQELIIQIQGYKDRLGQYKEKQKGQKGRERDRDRSKSRENTINYMGSSRGEGRDRDIQIDSGIRNSLRRQKSRLKRLYITQNQQSMERQQQSMENTFIYTHNTNNNNNNNNRYGYVPPQDLDISIHTKYSHMYKHPYQQCNTQKQHTLIHSPKSPRSPHSPRNTHRNQYHQSPHIINIQKSQSSYTMKQYQQCLKQMQIIISKLMKNLTYQLNNKTKANKQIERLCQLIKDYQLDIKYKNKCIYQLEKQLIVNQKEKQRNKQNYSQQKNIRDMKDTKDMKDRQIRSSTGSIKYKQNLQKSKQKYQQINRMITLSKQKQIQKDKQNGKQRQKQRQSIRQDNRYTKQGIQTDRQRQKQRQSIKGRLSQSKQRYQQYLKKYRKSKNTEYSPSPSNNTSNTNTNTNTNSNTNTKTSSHPHPHANHHTHTLTHAHTHQQASIKNNPNVQYNIYTNKQQTKRIQRTTCKQQVNKNNGYNDYYQSMCNSINIANNTKDNNNNNNNHKDNGYNLNRPRPSQNYNTNSKYHEENNSGKNMMVKTKNIGEFTSREKERDSHHSKMK